MRKHKLPLILVFCCFFAISNFQLKAQNTFSQFIYFNSNESWLDESDRKSLDSLSESLKAKSELQISILGHTDSDGSDAFNIDLAKKRANNVKSYLASKIENNANIKIKWLGEKMPVTTNQTLSGKAKNRRVEIQIAFKDYSNLDAILKEALGHQSDTFEIDPSKLNRIQTKSGINFRINPYSFVDGNGNHISGENIQIEVVEAISKTDCIALGLSTSSDDRLLETAGMFKLSARLNDKELKLKGRKADQSSVSKYGN